MCVVVCACVNRVRRQPAPGCSLSPSSCVKEPNRQLLHRQLVGHQAGTDGGIAQPSSQLWHATKPVVALILGGGWPSLSSKVPSRPRYWRRCPCYHFCFLPPLLLLLLRLT